MWSNHVINVNVPKGQVGGWIKARIRRNDDLPYPEETKEAHAGGCPQHGGIVVRRVLAPHCMEAPKYRWGNREPSPGVARSVGPLQTFDHLFQYWHVS